MDYSQFDLKAYIANHLQNVENKYPKIEQVYGKDFMFFLFQHNIDRVIRLEVIPLLDFPEKNRDFLDDDHWGKRHPFNFPGPFYTGESDTCGTGDSEAPANVMYDSYCCEYIFKQPKTYSELLCVIDAAAVEVFDSYSCNGNIRWTIDLCKQWWKQKSQLIEHLNRPEVKKMNGGREQLYISYLNSEAEPDLRKYCYFLDNGRFPANENTILPSL
jgi:hypothetical protein